MRHKILAGGVMIAGIAMLISLVQADLFGIAPEFEDMTDGFRPIMEHEALDTTAADVAALGAVSQEFGTSVMPQMSQALGMDQETFGGFMAAEFPAVATGVAALPGVVDEFTFVVNQLADQQSNFERADDIPTGFLPATTMPWIILIIGGGMLITGGFMFFRARSGSFATLGFGVLVLVAAIGPAFVPKANAADDMNSALKPVYTAEMVEGAGGAVQVVGAMGQEMQTAMLPALATQLELTEEQLNGFLGQFPATAAALQELPQALGRFTVLVETFDAELPNYQAVQVESLTPVAWTVIITGIATALLGLVGVLWFRREEPVSMPRDRELVSV